MRKFILLLLTLIIFGCGSNEKNETKKAEKEGVNSNTHSNTDADLSNTLCYHSETYCEGDSGPKLKSDFHLTIVENSVTANAFFEGCEGNGEIFYRGIKHEDTLILDEIFTETDGNEILTKTFWIMADDQLNQLVTIQKNGKTILKEETTHTFVISYEKGECE
jgi:hypothetical protein